MVSITLNQFPTHVAYTDNKVADNKYVKINNQNIYNGKISRFSRNTVMKNMHSWIRDNLPKDFVVNTYPLHIEYVFYTVANHAGIRRSKKKGIHYTPRIYELSKATWDIDNFAFIWIKAINDTLVKAGVILEDNVRYIRGGTYKVEFVDNFEDRKIIVNFKV